MRTGQVSIAALATAAALTISAGLALAQAADASAGQVPAPVNTNWPPTPPPFEAKSAAAATASPAATTAAVVPLPAPVNTNWPPAPPPFAATASAGLPAVGTTASSVQVPTSTQVEAVAKPPFVLGSDLTARLKADKSEGSRADRDAALKVYEARGGAPIWVSEAGFTMAALTLMGEIKNADAFGLQASAFKLPSQTWAPGTSPSTTELADGEATLTLAALKYARHARGGRLDPTALSPMLDRKPQVYAPDSVLTELASAENPAAYLRSFHPQHVQFERLRLKYLAAKSGTAIVEAPPPAVEPEPVAKGKGRTKQAKKAPVAPKPMTNAQLERKLLANMEMWRWMPAMGDTYVQNNIPEFLTRLYRGGKLLHEERIITGKADTPTPVFSDEFEFVVFKPFWNVPESIKWKELQPQLERNPGALSRVGLRASYNGREIDPSTVNWSQTDLRSFHVFQPPGGGNALGQVKFLFPNKHDVYMHDTPQKGLFSSSVRAFSHGCMRVRDPLKFAEMLLGADKGWDMAAIKKLANDGPENNEIKLSKKLPIHITYFTAWVSDSGELKTFNDIYRHEQKVHLGLEGKAHLIQQPQIVAEKAPPRRSGQLVRKEESFFGGSQSSSSGADWIKQIFNF